jgi:CBS domain containing-hemolysin-like protein
MMTFLLILTIVSVGLLLIVTAIKPVRSELSMFEIERRSSAGDRDAKIVLEREKIINDVLSLQRVVSALLLVIVVLLSVITLGWLFGVIFAIFVTLEYNAIARNKLISNLSQKIYTKYEKLIFKFITKYPYVFKFIRAIPSDNSFHTRRVGSRQELQHLVFSSGDALTADEKKLITNSLSFNDQIVSSVMTPQSVIKYIDKKEFLGPLVLNDLHKHGHSRLPVINDDINHVVGILYLKDLLTLDVKKSATAEKIMEPKVYYIRADQTLGHALAAFLKTHHHLFIVVNEYRETVGLLTLEDVIEALIGRKIIDEFDAHDDLRAVALRNLNLNNRPDKREDV